MLLYHGSNVEVSNPDATHSRKQVDFGGGFYLTSDIDQAKRWAVSTTFKRGTGTPIVSVFNLDEQKLTNFVVLRYEGPTKEWLDYVVHNRRTGEPDQYDVVIGLVANDNVVRTLNDYMEDGNAEIAIMRLETQTLTDQYAFRTDRALAAIELVSSEAADADGLTGRLHPSIIEFYDRQITEMIADKYKVSYMEAFKMFASSQTHRMLEQKPYMMCDFGYPAIFEIWETEKETGNPRNNPYLIGDEHD
ncbi:MAG: DUF3990 domain-containing protein [Clostridia bacterium]|nr:DUF3990 domain-containing protein [Clostridia bacterium]